MITVNLYYTGENGSARRFAEEMESSGTSDRIRRQSILPQGYRYKEQNRAEIRIGLASAGLFYNKVRLSPKDALATKIAAPLTCGFRCLGHRDCLAL